MSTPLEDEAATKAFFTGTHRTVPPDQTLARVLPLFPAFGITRVANLTGLDRIGIPFAGPTHGRAPCFTARVWT
jgi:ribosomal protein S12 methylthiotransferase accessory factor YcaO